MRSKAEIRSRQNARKEGLREILPRAGLFFQFFLLWLYQESGWTVGLSVSIDRFGLCKAVFTVPVFSHDASDLNHMHS